MNVSRLVKIKTPKDLHLEKGANFIDIKKYKNFLFEIDNEIIKSTKYSFPFKDADELVSFYTIEHQTKTFLWCNDNKDLVGYLTYIDQPDNGLVEMLNIGVLPQYQGQGFGQKMMEYYFDLMRNKGFKKSKLVTDPNNKPAKKLYEKLGYVNTKILKDYYGPGRDRILYIKTFWVV